jgi:thioredoxin reductase (NADPH)
MFDVIIIGRGPAGYAAGIYLSRAGRKVLIIGGENKIWNKNVIINNYFGVKELKGEELMLIGEEQVKGFGAEIVNDLIVKAEVENDKFAVTGDKKYECRNLLIATGAPVKKKEISNEEDYVGKGVSYCVACDGYFFKNKKVFVVGNAEYALQEAIELLDYTKDVTIVSNGKEFEFDKKLSMDKMIKTDNFKIEKIIGEGVVKAVVTNEGEKPVDGLFIMSGSASSTDFARMMGLELENDKIKVDENNKTNMDFVWAAGDCTPGLQQISTAVGEGATAATNIIKEGRR